MHVDHIGTDITGSVEQEAHPGEAGDRQVLAAGVEYIDINRIAPHRDRGYFDHGKWADAGVIARILAKGTFLAHCLGIRIYDAFDDDLGMRGDIEIHRLRPHDLERLL